MSKPTADERFWTAIEAIYDAAPDPQQWPRALAAIADFTGDVGSVLVWRRDDGAFGTIVSDSLSEAQSDYDQNGWSARDFRAIRSVERGYFFSGEAFTDRHVCSDHEVRTDTTYTQFLRRHNLGWFGAVAVSPDPHVGVALSVQRNSDLKPRFTDIELAKLSRLGRHVEKSLRLSFRLLNAEFANLALGDALARIGIGVFVLDSLARVIFANPAGRGFVGSGIEIVRDQLRIGEGSIRSTIDAAIQKTLRGEPQHLVGNIKPILLQRPALDRPLVIYLLPMTRPMNLAENFVTHMRAIVLVLETAIGQPADPALVRDILGLSLGEARIAALVGSGIAPREAAERLGIAEVTARNVLKRVFSKLGISRQAELAALLAKLAIR